MIVGNPMVRNNTHRDANSAEARAITWRCFGANFASDNAYPHPGTGPLDTIELPKRACAGGIRSNVFFPSCWNGKDLDPADHAVRRSLHHDQVPQITASVAVEPCYLAHRYHPS
jgi:hypothetical protein